MITLALVAVGLVTPSSTAAEPSLFERLSAHCGQAFAGSVTSDDPRDADFASARLVMHVRDCAEDEMRVPFHVGEDRSRTWVITRLEDGRLRLKHDHRHEDGSEDVLTQYGGETLAAPAGERAAFPADAESRALFQREGIPASMANTWSLIVTEQAFIYALDRPDRHFRAQFDLTQPVDTPPPPWGAD